MKQLEIEFEGKGSVTGFDFKQLKRTSNVAMYEKMKGTSSYEVFIVKIQKESDANFGGSLVHFEEKERYPNDEDFGNIAWDFNSFDNANKKYQSLVDQLG